MSRIAELHKRVQEVKGKIEGLDAKIAPAEEEIKRAQAQIEKDEATAREYDRMTMRLQMALAEDAQERSRLSKDRTMAEIQEDLRSMEIRIHKRLAESLATVIFAMIGVPLGIMTRRRSIMIAIAISFALVLLVFYPLLVAGQILAELSLVPIVPAIWSGNVITFLIGLILTVNVVRK
jgi:lipopolysaccharide export LptBFGC system permease protein LptF